MLAHSGSPVQSPKSDNEHMDEHEHTSLSDGEDGDVELGEGDYSRHMEEIMSDGESNDDERHGLRFDDDDEAYLYTQGGADEPVGGYQEQLKDVLGDEFTESETGEDRVAAKSLAHEPSPSFSVDEMRVFEGTPSTSSVPMSANYSPFRMMSPLPPLTASSARTVRPFLHPTVSRLRSTISRSVTQEHSDHIINQDALHLNTNGQRTQTRSPSHVSALSPTSSVSNLRAQTLQPAGGGREIFRWTSLRNIENDIYSNGRSKAKEVLGQQEFGSPTVLAANGLVCIGTVSGRVPIYDFKQNLICVCADETTVRQFGPVTALALSQDHTFLAVGHDCGHIQLFELKNPHKPARTVYPTTVAAVASGRKEGHLFGSRIIALGFVGGRHTAIVSADDQGLAFYHSLGKVLFVEASDILRILGKYPEEDPIPAMKPVHGNAKDQAKETIPHAIPRHRRGRIPTTILAMGSLPLGTSPDPTDAYNLIALLTPIKLVIVGLKPSPKTWFRVHREGVADKGSEHSRWSGCLAWFPSVVHNSKTVQGGSHSEKAVSRSVPTASGADPLLAYSWGSKCHLLRVSEIRTTHSVRNKKSQQIEKVESGKVVFHEYWNFRTGSDIVALQWYNANQVLVFTNSAIELHDSRQERLIEKTDFVSLSLVSPWLRVSADGSIMNADYQGDVAHSVRVYKGKIFTLSYDTLRVGTLLTWADRILSFVQSGDFLSAINLARAFYLGQADGNTNGLPEDRSAMREVVGQKIGELLQASARYAFSSDRLTDFTHVTPDHRGVDRTQFFQDLVGTSVKSCAALDNFDYLFEELFALYDNSGISRLYLKELEPFILDNSIHFVPPRITQRLVAMHAESGNLDDVERLIWHLDPECLDIDQVIGLCQLHHLYDALIYVYTRALRDFVSPVVELIGIIRSYIQRKKENIGNGHHSSVMSSIDALVVDAYKVYPYLENILSGLTYPSGRPLPNGEDIHAQRDVYSFLFCGRSTVWPAGDGGQLVLTAEEDGGVEPTYPYIRLLLKFDAEAFLHTLDIAFENGYLNDGTQGVSRQIIARILLDIVSASDSDLPSSDMTFVNIFLARNVPKYPQFIHLMPSSLQAILVRLTIDLDQSTREDRQLAAEYLLSAYTPHESDHILSLLESAGFFRIARTWYHQERRWVPLIKTFLKDPDLSTRDLFQSMDTTLKEASRKRHELPDDIKSCVLEAIPTLLQASIPHTALLTDCYLPEHHAMIVNDMIDAADHKRFAYLRCLLGPPKIGEDEEYVTKTGGPSLHLDKTLKELYITLLCRFDPTSVIDGIRYLKPDSLDALNTAVICEQEEAYDAAIWVLDQRDLPLDSLTKVDSYVHRLVRTLVDQLQSKDSSEPTTQQMLAKLQGLVRMGATVCLKHSQHVANVEVPLEDLWFKLLSCQIDSIQALSGLAANQMNVAETGSTSAQNPLSCLRDLVQETFTGLVSVSSTKAVSFPRLFKRLVDSTSAARTHVGSTYDEFRTILTGMLESYNSDGDLLKISRRIAQRDLFDSLQTLVEEKVKGWVPQSPSCTKCGKSIRLKSRPDTKGKKKAKNQFIVSRTGAIYHRDCYNIPPVP